MVGEKSHAAAWDDSGEKEENEKIKKSNKKGIEKG